MTTWKVRLTVENVWKVHNTITHQLRNLFNKHYAFFLARDFCIFSLEKKREKKSDEIASITFSVNKLFPWIKTTFR